MRTIIVYIDQDPSSLGAAATQDDLDTYACRLAAHLAGKFHGRTFEVEQILSPSGPCPTDADVNDYVTELQSGDGWTELLGHEVVIEIVSGEGDGQGHAQRWTASLHAPAIRRRLTLERCKGDRWAFCRINDRRVEDRDIGEAIDLAKWAL